MTFGIPERGRFPSCFLHLTTTRTAVNKAEPSIIKSQYLFIVLFYNKVLLYLPYLLLTLFGEYLFIVTQSAAKKSKFAGNKTFYICIFAHNFTFFYIILHSKTFIKITSETGLKSRLGYTQDPRGLSQFYNYIE